MPYAINVDRIETGTEKAVRNYCRPLEPNYTEPIVEAYQDEYNSILILTLKPVPDKTKYNSWQLMATAREVFEFHYGDMDDNGEPEEWLDDGDYILFAEANRKDFSFIEE